MGQRRGEVRNVIHVSHEDARRYLIDYHVGRLSPELNAGIEEHVRKCQLCQREGMNHAPTEMRQQVRVYKHVRSGRCADRRLRFCGL